MRSVSIAHRRPTFLSGRADLGARVAFTLSPWPRARYMWWSADRNNKNISKKAGRSRVSRPPFLSPFWVRVRLRDRRLVLRCTLPQNQHFLQGTLQGCTTQGRILLEKKYPHDTLLCAKAYRSMTSGCRGTPCFRRFDRDLVLKPAISLKKRWGGYR